MKRFVKEFLKLGQSTVHLFKKNYEAELKKGPGEEISQLAKKNKRRPLTLVLICVLITCNLSNSHFFKPRIKFRNDGIVKIVLCDCDAHSLFQLTN